MSSYRVKQLKVHRTIRPRSRVYSDATLRVCELQPPGDAEGE